MRPRHQALLLVVYLSMAAFPANAGLVVCNQTGYELYSALGFPRGDTWFSAGWYHFRRAICRELISGDLGNRYYFLYAHSPDDEVVRDGDTAFCAHPLKAFEIQLTRDCAQGEYRVYNFYKIDTGDADDFTLTLYASSTRAGPR